MSLLKEQFAKSYSLFALVRGLHTVIENDLRQVLKSNEINIPGFRILWILYFDSNIRMTDITYLAQTNISNVFRQLSKLEEEGLVIITNDIDARTKNITLTEEGRKIVQGFIEANTNNSEIHLVHIIEKISNGDFSKLMENISLLSNELLGPKYSEFISKSSTDMFS